MELSHVDMAAGVLQASPCGAITKDATWCMRMRVRVGAGGGGVHVCACVLVSDW